MKIKINVCIILFIFVNGCSKSDYVDYAWQPSLIKLSSMSLPHKDWVIRIKLKQKLGYYPDAKFFNKVENEMLIFSDGKAIINGKCVNLKIIKTHQDVISLLDQLNKTGIFSISDESIKSKINKTNKIVWYCDVPSLVLTLNINGSLKHYNLTGIQGYQKEYPNIKEIQYLSKCYNIILSKIPELYEE